MKNILDNVTIIVLQVSLWTGRKQLLQEDLKLAAGSELPPEKLASLGSKRVMDPKELAPFAKFKAQAERALLTVGSRFLGGYAVPNDKVDALVEKLNVIRDESMAEKVSFLSRYEKRVQEWKDANPGWEAIISRSVESREYVGRQIGFRFQIFNINPIAGHETGLKTEINGLADQLRHEIRQYARTAWEDSFKGKLEVGQKALRPVRTMLDKIDGLSFLEPGLKELVTGIKVTLADMPKTGPIKGRDYASLCGVIHLLGNIPEADEIANKPPVEDEPDETAEMVMVEMMSEEEETSPHLPATQQQEEPPLIWF